VWYVSSLPPSCFPP